MYKETFGRAYTWDSKFLKIIDMSKSKSKNNKGWKTPLSKKAVFIPHRPAFSILDSAKGDEEKDKEYHFRVNRALHKKG